MPALRPQSQIFQRTWYKRTAIVFAVLAFLLLPQLPLSIEPLRLHPSLAALARDGGTGPARVIVQHSGDATAVERQILLSGGHVVKQWHIMPALVAELPASALPRLANIAGVRWVSPDSPVYSTGNGRGNSGGGSGDGGGATYPVSNTYLETLRVPPIWEMGLSGAGIGIAVIDSGVHKGKDFEIEPTSNAPLSRVRALEDFDSQSIGAGDVTGHGTHVSGIIAGSGFTSGGAFSGIAPEADIISLRVSNSQGMALESDLVDALQYVLDHKAQHNIRVVNLSLNASAEQSYHVSPINAAVEILWFNEIVVVAAAGNVVAGSSHNPIMAAPANDPFIITVGASDEMETPVAGDDMVAAFSAYGITQDGFQKPDIIAPGRNIISVLSPHSSWGTEMPDRVIGSAYIRLSGTSMAAPMVSGAIALLLEDEPNLTPDQVKYRLKQASHLVRDGNGRMHRYLDVYSAVTANTTESANTGIDASQLLWTGDAPVTWNSVAWNSVAWNSVAWNSVAWNAVAWNAVAWNTVYWDE